MLQCLNIWNDFPHPFSTRLLTRARIEGTRVEQEVRLPKTVPYNGWMLYVLHCSTMHILANYQEMCAEVHECVEAIETGKCKRKHSVGKTLTNYAVNNDKKWYHQSDCAEDIYRVHRLLILLNEIWRWGSNATNCASVFPRHHLLLALTIQAILRHPAKASSPGCHRIPAQTGKAQNNIFRYLRSHKVTSSAKANSARTQKTWVA